MVYIPEEWIWIVVVGFVLAFLLCLGIGANDVANTFGTSVGAKVLTLRQACILASIFETAGAIFLGAKVSETVRKGIIDVGLYENSTEEFLLGNVAALSGSTIWLAVATVFRVPVSTTHSVVGATVGFALVATGSKGIDWIGLGKIIASWFISPVLSGLITLGVFIFCDYFILKKEDPLEPGLRLLPLFYALTVIINVFSIVYEGPEFFYFDHIPLWGVFVTSFGAGIICAILVKVYLVPWQRKKITEECQALRVKELEDVMSGLPPVITTFGTGPQKEEEESVVLETFKNEGFIYSTDSLHSETSAIPNESCCNISTEEKSPTNQPNGIFHIYRSSKNTIEQAPIPYISPENIEEAKEPSLENEDNQIEKTKDDEDDVVEVKDRPENAQLFSFLQILTAIFGAFAHGGNDVSNGIGPLISIWLVATTQEIESSAMTPIWILAYGGIGISVGLWIWGRRVIETLGENLTTVTPSSGFSIEIGAAMTVLLASNLGIPISSTHCKVGSIVCVGRARSKKNVDWSLFRNIVMSWIITLPATMGLSAAFMALLLLSL